MSDERLRLARQPHPQFFNGEPPRGISDIPPGITLVDLLAFTDFTDRLGRLVYEDVAPSEAIDDVEEKGIVMGRNACPYAETPSRVGVPMNDAAFEARRRESGQMLAGLVWLRDLFLAQETGIATNTPQGLYEIGRLGEEALSVAFYRGDSPFEPHGKLPPYITTISQSGRALWTAAFHMIKSDQYKGGEVVTADEVLKFAEDKKLFTRKDPRDPTGKKKLACAAPTGFIRTSIDAVLTGGGRDPKKSMLGNDVDFQMLWEFHTLKASFQTELNKYWRLVVVPMQKAGIPLDEMEDYGLLLPDGTKIRVSTLSKIFLENTTTIQANLNRTLGRNSDLISVTMNDVLKAIGMYI